MNEIISSEENRNSEEVEKRPTGLTVLCILSFINIGIGVLSGLFSVFNGPMSAEELKGTKVELTKSIVEMKEVGLDWAVRMMQKIARMTELTNENHYGIAIIGLLVLLFGLFAVIKMFKGERLGFHGYIIYCLVAIFQLYIFISPSDIPTVIIIFKLLLSGLFVFLYSRYLKWMEG